MGSQGLHSNRGRGGFQRGESVYPSKRAQHTIEILEHNSIHSTCFGDGDAINIVFVGISLRLKCAQNLLFVFEVKR